MKISASVLLGSVAAVAVLAAPLPAPSPPGILSASTARTLIPGLEVAEPGSGDGYSRKEFPHWEARQWNVQHAVGQHSTASAWHLARSDSGAGSEFVLKRDGKNVHTNRACHAESGTWKSPYDGVTVSEAREIDIDHMVPLKSAWISGASSWTLEQRKSFANDITRPQLWAVTGHVNRAKSDSSPDDWQPPLTSFHCTYSKSWVQVKSYYELAVTGDEKTALSGMLDT